MFGAPFILPLVETSHRNIVYTIPVLLGEKAGLPEDFVKIVSEKTASGGLMHGIMLPGAQGRGIMVTEFFPLFRRKVLLLGLVEVLLHLFNDMLGFVVVFDFKVRRRLCHLIGMSAVRAELPFLEPVHVREGPASPRAPDNQVHDIWVLCAVS